MPPALRSMDWFGTGGQARDFMQQTDYAPLTWRHAYHAAPRIPSRVGNRDGGGERGMIGPARGVTLPLQAPKTALAQATVEPGSR